MTRSTRTPLILHLWLNIRPTWLGIRNEKEGIKLRVNGIVFKTLRFEATDDVNPFTRCQAFYKALASPPQAIYKAFTIVAFPGGDGWL